MPADQPLAQALRRAWLTGRFCVRSGRGPRRIAPAPGGPFDPTGPAFRAAQLVVPASGRLRHAFVEPDLYGASAGADCTLFRSGAALHGLLPTGDSATGYLANVITWRETE